MNEIYNVKKNLENKVNNFISTEIEWLPLNSIQVSNEQKEKIIEFFETLEDDDDVQNIFSNVELRT
jgi:transcriptional/translational regulatory protein YebC/TACO1